MTDAQRNALIAAGIAAAALALWLLYSKLRPMGAEEDGIRVKNGSVLMTTVSGAGFDPHAAGFKTRKLTSKGRFNVFVHKGDCGGGEFFALNADKITLSIGVQDGVKRNYEIGDSAKDGRLISPQGNFTLSADFMTLTDGNNFLLNIQAYDGKDLLLNCARPDEGTMEAFIQVVK